MQPIQADRLGHSHLRFMFGDTVLSFNLASDATFGEIARTLDELSIQRHGDPVAIDVTLERCNG